MVEIIGKKFGDLIVGKIHYKNTKLNYRKYLCKCKCGKEIIVDEIELLTGKILNCGCEQIQEYFLLKCNCCGKKIEVPFDIHNLKKFGKEWIDENENKHYDIIYQIDYSCDKCKFDNVINNDPFLSSENVQLLRKFINENCIIGSYFPLKERTTKRDFKLAYFDWLEKNNCFDKKLLNTSCNLALEKLYGETFMKSNGSVYMSKIKLKD